MNILENVDLRPFNTFGLSARARFFVELDDAAALPDLCALPCFRRNKVLWLGGGSNILLRGDYPGLVVKMAAKGIRETTRSDGLVLVEAQAGEIWHDFVQHTIALGLNGLENLSLIPGTVGAAPVQNIGAYGVEVKDLIRSVRCFDLDSGRFLTLDNAQCRFAYRDSLFKQEGRGRYVITAVTFAALPVPPTSPKPSAASAAPNCPTRRCRAMSAASSKTPSLRQNRPAALPPPFPICRATRRATAR